MAEQKPNQNGGAREGAGRPKGSSSKIRVTDFFNGDERDELIMNAKLLAFGTEDTKPDKDMIKFCWEQLFGKSTQRTELTGAEGEVLKIVFDNALKGE
tara:strand:+ start:78 stop:371 length:294 start_codon:yes stop_codon:yes gene_type:complete